MRLSALLLNSYVYACIPHLVKIASPWMRIFGKKLGSLHGGEPPADVMELEGYPQRAALETCRAWFLDAKCRRVSVGRLEQHVARNIVVDPMLVEMIQKIGNRSAIICTPHYGSFMDCALWMIGQSTAERPLQFFYDPPSRVDKNASFDELFLKFSDRAEVLHNNNRGVISALKRLRKGGLLGMMPDVLQEPEKSVSVPFCGRLYPVMQGSAFFAIKSNAPIITVYSVPDPSGPRTRLMLGTVLEPADYLCGEDEEQSIFEMTRALYADLDAQLRREPWHWAYWNNVGIYGKLIPPASRYELQDGLKLLAHLCEKTPELTRQVPALRQYMVDVDAAPLA
ncbi:MAG: lysophospholipid acyltransferase family protein [Pseudomonadota bacterium]